jgi:NTE family protein
MVMKSEPDVRRAIVLSGGGGRGAFQCGVIERLDELGWRPDALVGTSIGSMNAAVWALGGAEGVGQMWEKLNTRKMSSLLRWPPWESLLDRRAWRETLEVYAPEEGLAETETPLYIVTTHIRTGHPAIYTNSPNYPHDKPLYREVEALTHDHLLASSSIPFVYPTTHVDEAPHWDGAVLYNSPLRPAVDSGAEEIMIVLLSPYHDLGQPQTELPPAPSSLFGKVGYLLDLTMTATFENDFEQMRKINRRVRRSGAVAGHRKIKAALIGPKEWLPVLDIIRYKPARIAELRELGRQAAEETWQRIQQQGWDSLG